jgi:Ca-activated chloride channel homolog
MPSFLVVLLLLTLSGVASAQQPGDLPSAPSAVREESKRPAPLPAPAVTPASPPAAAAPVEHNGTPHADTSSDQAPIPAETANPGLPPATGSTNDAAGSGTSDRPEDQVATIRRTVNEVNVIFTVTDKHGRFVKNLTKSDFRVFDDKKPQPSVVSFRSETDLPLRVGLLVDSSNSVRDRFKFEQEAAIEFLNQIIRPRSDKAFVIGFDTSSEVTQDFTENTERLSHGVRMLRPGGGTAMYDAIYYAARDKLMKSPDNGPVRRAIIVLSDGEDNQSHVTREEAIEMAQRAEVIVYCISTNISGVKMHGDKVMERIAEATGGRPFFPFKVEDVADAFTEIQDELRSQYALGYRPADLQRDGRFHAIEIVAEGHKDLRVRTRRGYFAPAQ